MAYGLHQEAPRATRGLEASSAFENPTSKTTKTPAARAAFGPKTRASDTLQNRLSPVLDVHISRHRHVLRHGGARLADAGAEVDAVGLLLAACGLWGRFSAGWSERHRGK